MMALETLTVRGPSDNSSEEECHWSSWSSCSYYCGDPKVETKYRALVDAIPKNSRGMCPLLQEEPCGAIACTGEIFIVKHKSTWLLIPRAFPVWSMERNRAVQWELRQGQTSGAKILHSNSSWEILLQPNNYSNLETRKCGLFWPILQRWLKSYLLDIDW